MAGGDELHRVRSLLALVKMRIETGNVAPGELIVELDEAIALLMQAEEAGASASAPMVDRTPVAAVIVDDEPRLADALARRLAREGLVTRSVYSLADLVRVEQADPEVVILDLSAAVIAEPALRRRAATTRPLVVTGADLTAARPLLSELQPFAVLQKPFSSEYLASLVRRRAAGGAAET